MRIGIMAGATGGDDGLDALVASAKDFEARGFDTMWMANIFGIDDLWRPAEYICNQYAPGSNGTITDETTGLIWQQAGSAYPMNWQNAAGYIDQLNRQRFASLKSWRLPTIN